MTDFLENVALMFALMASGAGVTVLVLALFIKLLDYLDSRDRS